MPYTQSSLFGESGPFPIENGWDRLNDSLSRIVNVELSDSTNVEILEAGCGRRWLLNLPGVKYNLVGVDRDEGALRARIKIKKDLDAAIVGDLETIELQKNRFRMIYCSYVLEHIEDAELLLSRMLDWLQPGGLLVLKIPIRESVMVLSLA